MVMIESSKLIFNKHQFFRIRSSFAKNQISAKRANYLFNCFDFQPIFWIANCSSKQIVGAIFHEKPLGEIFWFASPNIRYTWKLYECS